MRLTENLTEDVLDKQDLLDLCKVCCGKLTQIGYKFPDKDLVFDTIDSYSMFGACTSTPNRQGGYYTIYISIHHMHDSEKSIENTIYHELAHYFCNKQLFEKGIFWWETPTTAVCKRSTKPKPHGPEWRAIANDISRKLHLDPPITTTGKIEPNSEMNHKTVYRIICPKCKATTQRQKNSSLVQYARDGKELRCYNCGYIGKFDVD